MTFTKGPWEASRHEVRPNDVDIFAFANARLLASVHMPGDVPDDWRTQEANARLIAKAPEMFELLKRMAGLSETVANLIAEIENRK